MSLSITNGRTSTVPVYMTTIPSEQALHTSTDPNAIIIKQGKSGTNTVTVKLTNSYESVVSLRCIQLPSGATITFNTSSFTLAAEEEAISTLTTSSTAAKSIHPINIETESEHEHASDVVLWLGLLLHVS